MITAIIQARMGSTRLPGKVLMKIEGKPMIWHVIDRLKRSKLIDLLVVATTTNKEDDPLEFFLKKAGINFYRGSEQDVLGRYYQAALIFHSDVIVRITGDCPLIDPGITDDVISAYLKRQHEYDGASNVICRTFPRGLDTEVFSFLVLKKMWKKAKRPLDREHVTPYLYRHSNIFKMLSVKNCKDFSTLRWTVDEVSDLHLIKSIYKNLYLKKRIFGFNTVINLLKSKPRLATINSHVKQKKI